MKNLVLQLIRKIALIATERKFRRYQMSLQNLEVVQKQTLKKLIQSYKKTELGQQLDINENATDLYAEFTKEFKISTYEQLKPFIEEQMQTGAAVLTYGKVRCYEKTSGSSGKTKFIPYNKLMFDSFSDYFLIWLHDLLKNGPTLTTGKTFLSLSPAFTDKTKESVQIGLDSDTDYVNLFSRLLISHFIVTPHDLKSIQDPYQYRFVLALSLLSAPDLEIISIWNPSYLDSLLDFISDNRSRLCVALDQGTYQYQNKSWKFQASADVFIELKKPAQKKIDFRKIWPQLKILSCWRDGTAQKYAHRLLERVSAELVQAKGLLATEAPMTLPLIESDGALPFPEHIFYEFISTDGKIHLLHQLEAGQTYEIVVTVNNGFNRYKMGDKIKVVRFHQSAPVFTFVGRSERLSDLVGEKLSSDYVEKGFEQKNSTEDFLIPDTTNYPPCYRLVTHSENAFEKAQQLEEYLMQATHYRLARLLGQLDPVKPLIVTDCQKTYYKTLESLGMKWGDIKFQRLLNRTDFIGSLK